MLQQIREEQKLKYDKTKRLEKIKEKYSTLIILDKETLAAERIKLFFKKYVLHPILNECVSGIYRLRMDITQINLFTDADHDQIYEILFTIGIDLRIYGDNPDMSCYVPELDQTMYFTLEQQTKIKNVWSRINPSTDAGIKYQQILDCSKAMAEYYKKTI